MKSDMESEQKPFVYRQETLAIDHDDVRLSYLEATPSIPSKGTVLLIHGFPQSSYQFRYVLEPLAEAGYRAVAPDYRGHGFSSRPIAASDWTKRRLAQDLFRLITEKLGINEPIHVVGHDIGGMIAHAYVAQFPDHVASIIWGECPLPGTDHYEAAKHSSTHWHFDFHSHDPVMASSLVAGKERLYIKHFFDKLTVNHAAFSPDVLNFYAEQYSMPAAMQCAFLTYRAFEEDAKDNRQWRATNGKVSVRSMILSGEGSWARQVSLDMAKEMYSHVTEGVVENSGHYLAEENPAGFVREILRFLNP